MADRVHPVDIPTAPVYGGHSRSSSMASSVSNQMPERDVRKEQEQGLIGASRFPFESAPPADQFIISTDARHKDHIYKTPEPLPPNHPSRAPARRARRRRSCCCRCLAWSCATLALIVVLLGIAALVFYLVVKPKAPDFSVSDASVPTFNLTSSAALNSDVTLTVVASNPNTKITIRYDSTDVALSYADSQIGTGSIPAFSQGHRNTTRLALHMTGQAVPLTASTARALQASLTDLSSAIPLTARVTTKVRVKVGAWTSGASTVRVHCDIQISNPLASSTRLLSKSCSYALKSFKLW